jgi:hypothetical protein
MFTRKLMLGMAALAMGLVGFGAVLADDGPPRPTPAEPTVPPVVAALSLPTKNEGARLAKALSGMAAKGERMILVQAICMDVPGDFCEESGLEDDQRAWSLSPREARLFNALIRALKEKGTIDIIAQPQLVLQDNQTGFAQVGQNFPYVSSAEVKGKDGKIIEKAKIAYQPLGVTLKVAPRFSADGKSILLRVETQTAEVSPKTVDLGNGVTSPVFSTQSASATVTISDTGTAVIRADPIMMKPAHRKNLERVWVLTTHIVRGSARPGTPPPAGSKQAIPAPPVLAPLTVLPVPPMLAPLVGPVPVPPPQK